MQSHTCSTSQRLLIRQASHCCPSTQQKLAAPTARCQSASDKASCYRPDRRTVALSLLPLLLPAAAHALVPDQDEEDDKLIQQAKANRGQRLKGEQATEANYSVSAGANKNGDITSIQRAINRLGKSGADLEAGNLKELAADIKDKWVDQFKTAAQELTTTSEEQSNYDSLVSSIASLGSASAVPEAKQQYVAVVQSFQSWVNLVGLQNALKGL